MEDLQVIINDQIVRAKKGNQAAFKFLLNTYWSEVYNFQLRRTKNTYEAEEITIQSFSRAFDRLDSYDFAYSFKNWLFQISKNIHIDLLRKEKKKIKIRSDIDLLKNVNAIPDATPSPEDYLIQEQNLSELLRYIKQLKPHFQTIIQLRYFQELTYKQIATKLDEPINNVKVRLLRAKNSLATIIKKYEA